MGLNDIIKYIFIGIAITVVCSVSSAGARPVFITTDKQEMRSAVDSNISSGNKKRQYFATIDNTSSRNEYRYSARSTSPNEIEFVQTGVDLALFQLVGDELTTVLEKQNNAQVSKIVFKRKDDQNIQIFIERVSFEGGRENPLHYEVSAAFKEGNWEDLANNRKVTIAVSRQDEIKSKRYIQEWLRRTVFYKAVQKASVKIKQVVSTADLEFRAPIISGNLEQMVHTVDKTKAQFEVHWGLF